MMICYNHLFTSKLGCVQYKIQLPTRKIVLELQGMPSRLQTMAYSSILSRNGFYWQRQFLKHWTIRGSGFNANEVCKKI